METSGAPTSSAIVLVLEDDDERARRIRQALADTHEPVAVVRTRTRAEFLRGIARNPALIITGIQPPGTEPFEALKLATADGATRNVIVVAPQITGDLAADALRHGADDIQPLEPSWRLQHAAAKLLRIARLTLDLHHRAEREQAILATGSDLHLICDPDTRIRWASQAARRTLSGQDLRRLEGTLLSGRVAAANIDALYAAWDRAGKDGVATIDLPVRADGSTVTLAATVTDLRENPGVRGFLVTATDRSDLYRAEDKLRSVEQTDRSTGIATMRALRRHLEAVRRRRQPFSLVAVRIGGIGSVNGSHGHTMGEEALKEIVDRVVATAEDFEEPATPYRMFGSVFGVLVVGRRRRSELAGICRAMREVTERPIHLSPTRSVNLSARVGAAYFDGDTTFELEMPVDRALSALSEASADRSIRIHDDEIAERNERRATVQTQLIESMESGRLELHYQPIVDAVSRAPAMVESLVRFPTKAGGLIPVGEALDTAKRHGLVVALERRIGQIYAAEAAEVMRMGRGTSDVTLNVTDEVLGSNSVLRELIQSLEHNGADLDRVLLELRRTHGDMLPERLRSVLLRLGVRGIRVVWDNLDTASVPIRELAELDIDSVKIQIPDRHDSRRMALAAKLAEAAASLDIRVIGMRVGTPEAWATAVDLGVDMVQGFAVAKPMKLEDLSRWMSRSVGAAMMSRSA